MQTFITAIRHPETSNNFARVEELFEATMRSICAQTDPNFRIVVVTNRIPKISFADPRIEYLQVKFPPPTDRRSPLTGFPNSTTDKGTKLLAGILFARQYQPDYLVLFDADDLINRHLVEFLNRNPAMPGWYVDAGYVLDISTRRTQRKRGLVRYCGTAQIPNMRDFFQLTGISEKLTANASKEQLTAEVSSFVIDELLGNHRAMVAFFRRHGRAMKPLPFHATAWVICTGENQSGTQAKSRGLPITPEFCREFGLVDSPMPAGGATLNDRMRELGALGLSWAGLIRERIFGPSNLPTC